MTKDATGSRGKGSARRSPAPHAVSGRPVPPTPKALGGRTDPARLVRPVDWSASGRRTSGEDPAASAPSRGGSGPTGARGPGAGGAGGPTGAGGPGTAGASGAAGSASGGPSARLPRRRARTVELPRPLAAPPTDAVHSLSAEDPRPLPRPLRIRDEDIRTVGVQGLPSEQIVQAVADPEDAWTADAGASDHFRRGELVVQVRRADNAVIGLFSTRYALSVRPEEYEPALDAADAAAGPSARGGQGTRHPTSRRELLRRMESEGFVVTPGATHGKVTHPDHPGLVLPFASTPSDRRFTRHAVAQIRRVFGIDLRH